MSDTCHRYTSHILKWRCLITSLHNTMCSSIFVPGKGTDETHRSCGLELHKCFLEKERWLLRALWLSLDQPPTDWLYTCDITSAAEELWCDSHIDSSDCTVLQGCFRINLLPDIIYESMAPSSADSRRKCCLCSPVYEPGDLSRNAADLIIEMTC